MWGLSSARSMEPGPPELEAWILTTGLPGSTCDVLNERVIFFFLALTSELFKSVSNNILIDLHLTSALTSSIFSYFNTYFHEILIRQFYLFGYSCLMTLKSLQRNLCEIKIFKYPFLKNEQYN